MIAVTGATGHPGRLVVHDLLGRGVPPSEIVDAAAATVLTEDGHEDERYELGGDEATTDEPADVVTDLGGTEVVHRDLPVEDYQQALVDAGLPESQAEVFADAGQGIAEGHFYTQSDDLRRPIGRPTTPLEEAVADAPEARA